MKKLKLQSFLSILFVLLTSCSSAPQKTTEASNAGPLVTVCVVDVKAGGYQCVAIDQSPFFLDFKDAGALECMSNVDLESYLKACKKGVVLSIPLCTASCIDNSVCLSSKDWKRVSDRCS